MLSYVNMEESLKFLRQICDVLFAIQNDQEDERIQFLVYESLLRIVGYVMDKRIFGKLKTSTMDEYIRKYFKFDNVHYWLLDCLEICIDNHVDLAFNSNLKDSMKSLDYIFFFARCSFKNFEENHRDDPPEEIALNLSNFKSRVQTALVKINRLMCETEPKNISFVQEIALKHISSFWDSFVGVLTGEELGNAAKDFLDGICKSRDIREREHWTKVKLTMIGKISKGQPFIQEESRRIILPKLMEELQYHLDRGIEEQIDSILILSNMLDILQAKVKKVRFDVLS